MTRKKYIISCFSFATADGAFTYRYYVCTLPPKAQLINYCGKATN